MAILSNIMTPTEPKLPEIQTVPKDQIENGEIKEKAKSFENLLDDADKILDAPMPINFTDEDYIVSRKEKSINIMTLIDEKLKELDKAKLNIQNQHIRTMGAIDGLNLMKQELEEQFENKNEGELS